MILRMVWIHIFVTLRMIKTTDDGWRMTVVLWHDGCFGWRFKSCFLNLIILWSCKLDTFSIFCQIDYHVQTVLPDFCSYLHVHYMFNPLYRDDDPNGFVHIVFVDGLKTSQCDLPGKGLCQQSSGAVYWIPKDLKEVGELVVRIIPKMDVYGMGFTAVTSICFFMLLLMSLLHSENLPFLWS